MEMTVREHLQDLFTSEKWQDHFKALTDALGFTLGIYSDRGEPIFLPAGTSPLCNAFRSKSPELKSQCETHCLPFMLKTLRTGTPEIFQCYAKLMSFAIPINVARSLVDQMLEFGDIRRGALGFTYDDFTSARPHDLAGAVVRAVDPQSAAERAGLKPGDLVTELGSTPVRDAADLHIKLALLRIGEIAEFGVSRPGGTLTVRAEMAEREPDASLFPRRIAVRAGFQRQPMH